MKRITHYKVKKQCAINIMAYGLSNDEIREIVELIKKMNQKRSHRKRPRLLYDMLFDCSDNSH